jgi:hypothetical protein
MKSYLATKKNGILSFTGKWMELENIILCDVCQAKKLKSQIFSLICKLYSYNKCSNIIEHGSHTKGRTGTGGIGQEKETKNLKVVDVLPVEE